MAGKGAAGKRENGTGREHSPVAGEAGNRV